ncbi:MAG: hypothetical protein GY781_10345, partial [Gammaproteobacteria bacterium]|nr:hypothetical protein [Gammaproteobacteria bacterium]
PILFINRVAGTTAVAVPTIINVSGKVANSGKGAIFTDNNPPASTITGKALVARGITRNNNQIFCGSLLNRNPSVAISNNKPSISISSRDMN